MISNPARGTHDRAAHRDLSRHLRPDHERPHRHHPPGGRVEIVRNEVAHLENGDADRIEVRAFDTLLMGFAHSVGAKVIIRGLRAVSDFEYEFQMAGMNARLNPEIETVFLMASDRFQFISSRFVKEIGALGGDVSHFVSPRVAARLLDRFATGRSKPRRRAAAAD
jgi:pantetheine-phosphate adenylyltransferase